MLAAAGYQHLIVKGNHRMEPGGRGKYCQLRKWQRRKPVA
jgi:hypothetical protein